jgi:hypothetical protein
MKKLVLVVMMMALATSVMAMGVGPLAQTAAPIDVGQINLNAGVVIGMDDDHDQMLGSARVTYGVIEALLISIEAGYDSDGFALDMSGDEGILTVGLAAQYALTMLDLPVDLAVRVGYSIPDTGNMGELSIVTPMLVVSAEIGQVSGLAIYGGVGMAFFMGDLADLADLDSELALVGGATYGLPVEGLSVFAEYQIIDDSFLGVGLTYGL